MARKGLSALALALGCLFGGEVAALGLGELTLSSFLNEPLRARVDLLDTSGLDEDQIRIRLATSEDFDRLGIDRAYFLTSIQFEVIIDASGSGYIEVSSEDPVLEPYLDFVIEARWPSGRLLREYTVLVDPPTFSTSTRVISAKQQLAEPERDSSAKKPNQEQAEVRTGTVVQVGGSSSASAGTTERSYGAGAEAQPISGEEYLIKRNDTLWAIASRARPAGASVQQTMLDIQRLNPNAFIGGNINTIKAGYVIYLPQASEIATAEGEAVAEVQQQNANWRDGVVRDVPPASLKISSASADSGQNDAQLGRLQSQVALEQESLEVAQRENEELNDRLGAVEDQLQTLERIISLKDEQIAALQSALANAESLAGDATSAPAQGALEPVEADLADPAMEAAANDESVAEAAPAASNTKPTSTAQQTPGLIAQLMDNLVYIIGLIVVIVLAAVLFMRRRDAEADEDDGSQDDSAFTHVQLADEESMVIDETDETDGDEADVASEVLGDHGDDGERGYGRKKHDQYADDVETGDALAEADIYIAYGRYPQAVELLKNAITADPANPAYRVKLTELAATMNDRFTAQQQYADLRALGDTDSLQKAEEAILEVPEGETWLVDLPPSAIAPELADTLLHTESDEAFDLDLDLELGDDGLELEDTDADEIELTEAIEPEAIEPELIVPNEPPEFPLADAPPKELTADSGESLEQSFGELEIELSDDDDIEADLDLSADFNATEDTDDESMVFAAETDEASTKLDLARAYLDMGDEDGARQILEEVVADGSGSIREEAQALLEGLS